MSVAVAEALGVILVAIELVDPGDDDVGLLGVAVPIDESVADALDVPCLEAGEAEDPSDVLADVDLTLSLDWDVSELLAVEMADV